VRLFTSCAGFNTDTRSRYCTMARKGGKSPRVVFTLFSRPISPLSFNSKEADPDHLLEQSSVCRVCFHSSVVLVPKQRIGGDCLTTEREDQNYSTILNRKDQITCLFPVLVLLLRYFFGGDIGAWITYFVISFRENSRTVVP
jgi:hypothetical protein